MAREGGVEEIDVASSAAKSPRSRLSALVAGKVLGKVRGEDIGGAAAAPPPSRLLCLILF